MAQGRLGWRHTLACDGSPVLPAHSSMPAPPRQGIVRAVLSRGPRRLGCDRAPQASRRALPHASKRVLPHTSRGAVHCHTRVWGRHRRRLCDSVASMSSTRWCPCHCSSSLRVTPPRRCVSACSNAQLSLLLRSNPPLALVPGREGWWPPSQLLRAAAARGHCPLHCGLVHRCHPGLAAARSAPGKQVCEYRLSQAWVFCCDRHRESCWKRSMQRAGYI